LAYTKLTVQETLDSGTVPTYTAAAADGNSAENLLGMRFYVKNDGIASINVTVKGQANCSQGFRHDQVVAVPNDDVPKEIGPFRNDRYLNRDGLIEISYSAVTDVSVAAVRPSIS
jgi:hypothetical protein